MSNKDEWTAGDILWQDLTVSNAIEVRDFYREIIGWDCISEDMGGYDDFHMVIPPSGNSIAGICHARGENADLPPIWLIYIAVENVGKSAQLCKDLGGEVCQAENDGQGSVLCDSRSCKGSVYPISTTCINLRNTFTGSNQ